MSHLFWYSARAAGIVGWALLSASVIWGLWLSGRVRPMGARPAWILDLHRFLGGLATIFVGVHVVTIMADSYTSFGPTDVLVPFASSWHPVAVAWGVVGMYLLLAVELTSLARRHLPNTIWRLTHIASLPLFVVATIHYLAAGTDAMNRVSLGAVIAVSATVGVLFARRMSEVRARGGVLRAPAATGRTPGPEPVPAADDRIAALAARRAASARR